MSRVIAVDVGGTFTDAVVVEDGRIGTAKVATVAEASDASVLEAAREVDVARAEIFNLASTAGLNAVLTRRLPKVAFLTTMGHRDMLDHGTMIRPLDALTDPGWRRNFGDAGGRPLVARVPAARHPRTDVVGGGRVGAARPRRRAAGARAAPAMVRGGCRGVLPPRVPQR